jgi:hypothetical protein
MAREKKELDKEWLELLNELRVVLPGVQVLFAFLLAAPFSAGFGEVTHVQKNAYFLSLLATTLSSALLTAPTTFHRLRWRHGDKERMLQIMNRLTLTGVGVLALAMTSAFFVIADVLFGGPAAALWTAVVGLTFGVLWYGLALKRAAEESD